MISAQSVLIVAGIGVIFATLNDIFASVIVPRAVGTRFRPSFNLRRYTWKLWPRLAWRIHPTDDAAREDFLAIFAPLNLILTLMMWSLLLLIGYGMILYALRYGTRPTLGSFAQAFYFAGTSFFTIGFGDFVGNSGWTRLVSLAAGASGFGVISTTTAFLFAIFGAFQVREAFVVAVGARAGSPPSGLGLLTVPAQGGIAAGQPELMRDAQVWCASLMETHLAYPVLAYFRSSHNGESWVGTLGTLLDAATLMMTTVRCDAGEARIFFNIGRHVTSDLSRYFRVGSAVKEPGITRAEFDDACNRLANAGYALHERNDAWERFASLRSSYAGHLNALAHFLSIPPLRWIGDRSYLELPHQNP